MHEVAGDGRHGAGGIDHAQGRAIGEHQAAGRCVRDAGDPRRLQLGLHGRAVGVARPERARTGEGADHAGRDVDGSHQPGPVAHIEGVAAQEHRVGAWQRGARARAVGGIREIGRTVAGDGLGRANDVAAAHDPSDSIAPYFRHIDIVVRGHRDAERRDQASSVGGHDAGGRDAAHPVVSRIGDIQVAVRATRDPARDREQRGRAGAVGETAAHAVGDGGDGAVGRDAADPQAVGDEGVARGIVGHAAHAIKPRGRADAVGVPPEVVAGDVRDRFEVGGEPPDFQPAVEEVAAVGRLVDRAPDADRRLRSQRR